MPLYDFRCRECRTTFERLLRATEPAELVACPSCGKTAVERLLSAPSRSAGSGERGKPCAPRGGFT